MNDAIVDFLKTADSRITFRGYVWVKWVAQQNKWGVFVERDNGDVDMVYMSEDITAALAQVYGAARMSKLEVTA